MKSTIDSAGRIVVPKAPPMTLVKKRGGRVAVPSGKLPPLTDEIVRETLEQTRR